jgi:hypothetical protein
MVESLRAASLHAPGVGRQRDEPKYDELLGGERRVTAGSYVPYTNVSS